MLLSLGYTGIGQICSIRLLFHPLLRSQKEKMQKPFTLLLLFLGKCVALAQHNHAAAIHSVRGGNNTQT